MVDMISISMELRMQLESDTLTTSFFLQLLTYSFIVQISVGNDVNAWNALGILYSPCLLILLIHTKHKDSKMKSWTDPTPSFP